MSTNHPFGTLITEQDLTDRFAVGLSWEERYRQLIALARQLPPLSPEFKREEIAIEGCENRVWLGYQLNADHTLHFYAESEGRIVRGLLAVLLTVIEGKTATDIQQRDLLSIFHQLGLMHSLSVTRNQGLQRLVKRVDEITLLSINSSH